MSVIQEKLEAMDKELQGKNLSFNETMKTLHKEIYRIASESGKYGPDIYLQYISWKETH